MYIHHIFFIHSSVDEHSGCFHILATLNSAAVNVGVLTHICGIEKSGVDEPICKEGLEAQMEKGLVDTAGGGEGGTNGGSSSDVCTRCA